MKTTNANEIHAMVAEKSSNLLANGFVLVGTDANADCDYFSLSFEKKTAGFYASVELITVMSDDYGSFVIRSFQYNYRNNKYKSCERHYSYSHSRPKLHRD